MQTDYNMETLAMAKNRIGLVRAVKTLASPKHKPSTDMAYCAKQIAKK